MVRKSRAEKCMANNTRWAVWRVQNQYKSARKSLFRAIWSPVCTQKEGQPRLPATHLRGASSSALHLAVTSIRQSKQKDTFRRSSTRNCGAARSVLEIDCSRADAGFGIRTGWIGAQKAAEVRRVFGWRDLRPEDFWTSVCRFIGRGPTKSQAVGGAVAAEEVI